jgi:hypothetical protein
MANLSTIIDYCISVNNKSGSIPPAPQGIKKLKESIEGLPFELLTKSMSGIFDQLPQQINQLIQSMGGIQNMGGTGVQQILSQIQKGTASPDQIIAAFGGVTSMTAGLSGFLSSDDLKSVTSIAPGTANTGG